MEYKITTNEIEIEIEAVHETFQKYVGSEFDGCIDKATFM